jgi:RNA polymerase sigma-70 factor, ECF subfamily
VSTSPSPVTEGECNPKGTLGALLHVPTADAEQPVLEAGWVRLIQQVAAGDELALHEIYQRSNRIVFTLIMRVTRNRETAEELTVDVFHDVWRRASRYDATGGTVVGWIMNQARSRAIDRVRFEQRKKRVNPYPDEPALECAVAGSDEVSHTEERRRALQDALQELTPAEREAIESAFLGELSHAEVASQLNQPLGTVKTRIRSGLAKLRRSFATAVKQP